MNTPSWEKKLDELLGYDWPKVKDFIHQVEAQAIRDTIEKVREGIDNLRGWNDCVQGPEHHGTCEVCAARQSHNSTLKEVRTLLSSLTPNDHKSSFQCEKPCGHSSCDPITPNDQMK